MLTTNPIFCTNDLWLSLRYRAKKQRESAATQLIMPNVLLKAELYVGYETMSTQLRDTHSGITLFFGMMGTAVL